MSDDKKGPEFDLEVDNGRMIPEGQRLLNMMSNDMVENECQLAMSDLKEAFEKIATRALRTAKGDKLLERSKLDIAIGALMGMVEHMMVSAGSAPTFILNTKADVFKSLVRREVMLNMNAAQRLEAQINRDADALMRGKKS